MTSVIIGNGVESIGGFAFDGCSKLLEVYCYAEKVPAASSYPYPHYFFAYAFDTSFIKILSFAFLLPLLIVIRQVSFGNILDRLLPSLNDEYFPHDVNCYKTHNPQAPQ